MKNESVKNLKQRPGISTLLRILGEQRRVLMIAGCDSHILTQYSAFLQFLQSASSEELFRIFGETLGAHRERYSLEQGELEISNMSASEVENIINDDNTPRKTLEKIAIYRFRVPRGSMRSFSNRDMLVEKLSTLLRNEQAHRAIETVARAQGELPGMPSKR
jgi:hypothetical protein